MFYSNKDTKNFEKLSFKELISLLSEKSNVSVITCYYGIDKLNKFFDCLKSTKERFRYTNIVVSSLGSNKERLLQQVSELMSVKLNDGQNLFLCRTYPLLHTKLYLSKDERFSKNSHCLVGSLNLSDSAFSSNEEILFDVEDAENKNSAERYFERIKNLKDNIDIRSLQEDYKKYQKDNGDEEERKLSYLSKKFDIPLSLSENTIGQFISSGYIFVKWARTFSLSFSSKKWKKWVGQVPVEMRNTSITMSIDVMKMLGIKKDKEEENAYVKNNSIESCFGMWLPRGFKYEKVKSMLDNQKEKRKKKYDLLVNALAKCVKGKKLSNKICKKLEGTFSDLNDRRNKKLKRLSPKDFENLKDDFYKHLKGRLDSLRRNEDVYINNGQYLNPMPYIWDDASAVKEFLKSFLEDIKNRHNIRLGRNKRVTKMVDAVSRYLNITEKTRSIELNYRLPGMPWLVFEKNNFKQDKT